jgi:hypothetical protein
MGEFTIISGRNFTVSTAKGFRVREEGGSIIVESIASGPDFTSGLKLARRAPVASWLEFGKAETPPHPRIKPEDGARMSRKKARRPLPRRGEGKKRGRT